MPLSRFLLILFTATLAIATAQAAEKLVTVTGEATVAVPPDTAVIRIGVSSMEKTAREAGEANAKQMTAVLAAIKASGIAERDIQTSRLSLQPQYDPNKGGTARLTGFQATNQVTIRIRDIDNLPTVLDRAIAAGANEMSGIEFVVSEQSKLLDQARRRSDRRCASQGRTLCQGCRCQARTGGFDQRRRARRAAAADAGRARRRGSDRTRRADTKSNRQRQL